MVKKITKYLKFVVCCALILSLVAPSYAALSASDGSAFVTKAEFDSALADFNARLTTFEAGINSKIDSQVTSYLDRNGIWNGQNQDYDIINTYKARNKWTSAQGGQSWYTSRGTWSQFEQICFYLPTSWATFVEKSKTIAWKNGEKTYTAAYEYTTNASHRPTFNRIYFFDNAFIAKKSGLCFYQICLSGGDYVRWYTPDGAQVESAAKLLEVNESIEYYYMSRFERSKPSLYAFWYDTSLKVADFGERDETNLYRALNFASAWEYIPNYALGLTQLNWGPTIPLSGNFFVTKNVAYGCAFRPYYTWSSSDYEWFLDDSRKVFDKGSGGILTFGPVTSEYARFLPKLAIY